MFATKNLQKRCFQTLSSRFITNCSKDVKLLTAAMPNFRQTCGAIQSRFVIRDDNFLRSVSCLNWHRMFRTSKGRRMRGKPEMRRRKKSQPLREITQARRIHMKLMSVEERLLFYLKRFKKKVALLELRLKKYKLPEFPPPRHDPELLTPEQIYEMTRIGFRNSNFVPVGVRGVFGGVVQNMHTHWKFHETVQVVCTNFPNEKIMELASMLARLSGGIVVHIHKSEKVIMYRGRNYRQPNNMIPINTLTKKKALVKGRLEQSLEFHKRSLKNLEKKLRRIRPHPDDPVAIASIQRVASTFFNAIDKKESGEDSDQEEIDKLIAEVAADKEREAEEAAKKEVNRIRYLYGEDYDGTYTKQGMARMAPQWGGNSENDEVDDHDNNWPGTVTINEPEFGEDSDQEELDKFITEIEDAAEKEWEAEETAEKQEVYRIRYSSKGDYDIRYTLPGMGRMAPQMGGNSENDEVDDHNELDTDEVPFYGVPKVERWSKGRNGKFGNGGRFNRRREEESE